MCCVFWRRSIFTRGTGWYTRLKNGNPKVTWRICAPNTKSPKSFCSSSPANTLASWMTTKRRCPLRLRKPLRMKVSRANRCLCGSINRSLSADALKEIQPGQADAGKYHDFIVGSLTEIFYPVLTRATKEQPVDEGRKRIDVFFHNSASKASFPGWSMFIVYHAPYISVECKNYSTDPVNPEFDQLLGRLNRKRGFVGS